MMDRNEAAEYYFTYIDQVQEGDICELLDAQGNETLDLLHGISDEESLHRYARGKWSIRDVVNHLNDTERLFVFRAFWFARGFESPLPSFDQTIAVAAANADGRSWRSLVEEFRAVRSATGRSPSRRTATSSRPRSGGSSPSATSSSRSSAR